MGIGGITPKQVSTAALLLTDAKNGEITEAWRREYNEERPKKSLGGLTPASYARKLAEKVLH